jgi:hypothetical protein
VGLANEPDPERDSHTSWKTLFQRRSLDLRGLVRYVAFFAMKIKTRTEEIAVTTRQPGEPWMTQIARKRDRP